jgi:2-deoxy-D-gluconate 3-dehydrogenase
MSFIENQFSLAGKTAVVTGASRGIGEAITRGFEDAGAMVIRWTRETADLSNVDSCIAGAEEILCNQHVDILVNNAGTIKRMPATETSIEDWNSVIQINLNSQFAISQVFGRAMIARGSGKIINIASLLSFQGGINVPAYTASKHAMEGLTKALANEWSGKGVNVNAIAPGYIETDNTAALRADKDRNASIIARIPAGRWGKSEDLVGAAIFLASASSNYVNGHTLIVDGGWMGR